MIDDLSRSLDVRPINPTSSSQAFVPSDAMRFEHPSPQLFPVPMESDLEAFDAEPWDGLS